jgi:hypothetical protein
MPGEISRQEEHTVSGQALARLLHATGELSQSCFAPGAQTLRSAKTTLSSKSNFRINSQKRKTDNPCLPIRSRATRPASFSQRYKPRSMDEVTPRAVITAPSSTILSSITCSQNGCSASNAVGCVVAFLPLKKPEAPNNSDPVHTETLSRQSAAVFSH